MNMSIYITPQDELHVENQGIALTCPHCQTLTHVSASATPKFTELSLRKPKQIGIVFRCDACGEPIFLRFPEEAELMFREALGCYSAGCYNAFAAMSRRAAQSLFRELGERGKLEMFDTLQEIRNLAELDDQTFATLRAVLFGSDSDPWPHQPHLNAESAGILLEVMRDLLYQTFVRKARLLQAMTFRKYVAPQVETSA
jgi:hypothetical protein